jgi:hypothetical protein
MNLLSGLNLHVHPEIMVACAAAALSAFTLLLMMMAIAANRHLRRRCEALESSVVALHGALVRNRNEAGVAATQATDRVRRLEQAGVHLTERLRFVERRSDGRSFDLAIDSARHGAASGQLAEQFGLSRGEAELVARLHGRARRA